MMTESIDVEIMLREAIKTSPSFFINPGGAKKKLFLVMIAWKNNFLIYMA